MGETHAAQEYDCNGEKGSNLKVDKWEGMGMKANEKLINYKLDDRCALSENDRERERESEVLIEWHT